MNADQEIFSYRQVTLLLSKYILAKKHNLFDPRNIMVALVAGDPLGKAFNVNAFHRCQVTGLLRTQLILVEGTKAGEVHEEEECNVSSTTEVKSSAAMTHIRKRSSGLEDTSPEPNASKKARNATPQQRMATYHHDTHYHSGSGHHRMG